MPPLNSVLSSGGGFGFFNVYKNTSAWAWQADAVAAYVKKIGSKPTTPVSWANAQGNGLANLTVVCPAGANQKVSPSKCTYGRGYPDLAMVGEFQPVVVGGAAPRGPRRPGSGSPAAGPRGCPAARLGVTAAAVAPLGVLGEQLVLGPCRQQTLNKSLVLASDREPRRHVWHLICGASGAPAFILLRLPAWPAATARLPCSTLLLVNQPSGKPAGSGLVFSCRFWTSLPGPRHIPASSLYNPSLRPSWRTCSRRCAPSPTLPT